MIFFRQYKLSNEFYIYYNAKLLKGEEVVFPVYEGYNEYKYYIPLDNPIDGYNRIVISSNAVKYIEDNKSNLDLRRLRISFYPWPEIILANKKYLDNGYHNEVDSIDDVYIRFDFIGNFMYHKSVPAYGKLIFRGLKAITNFNTEHKPLPRTSYDDKDIEEDYYPDESSYDDVEDAFYSGEYLPEDW